ncbi:hypothetical protein [Duganella qianjiadongensis]|uniref:Secretion system X translation initiation factor n=1 Tax=Duganella qianjiadongensis TaxID=2692176 RepID=A0ABW9VNX6_9BURK|nr:hypothetical protein [Duganella qianjiadongensis]MYM41180.1 hypothetical protein [Duganella qianjiadongensis]
MVKSARRRWTVLISLFAATLALIAFAPDEEGSSAIRPRNRIRSEGASPVNAPAALAMVLTEEADGDPFVAHAWTAPPPPPPPEPPKPAAVQVAQETVVVAPVAPPLPFKYVGRFSDDSGGVIYLSIGEQTLLAHAGDTLSGGYKILTADASRIEFEHIPTQTKQTLMLPSSPEL